VSIRAALTAALGLLCVLMIPASLAGQCTLDKLAEFPITMVDLRPLMTAKVNGTDVRFMVDSGAFWSVISPASAAELNLSTRPTPISFFMRGANGSASTLIAKVKEFALPGNVPWRDVDFLVGGSQVDRDSVGVLFLAPREIAHPRNRNRRARQR
jgi:Aspartyl protease